MSECEHKWQPYYQEFICTKCDATIDQYEVIEKLTDLERKLAEAKGVIASAEKAIKLNFHDVERLECCTETANWVFEKIEQLKEQD